MIIDNRGIICYNKRANNPRRRNTMNTTQKRIRHSATRDVIYNYLCGTKEHPSADMIYSELKPTMPTLSLGTVYTILLL